MTSLLARLRGGRWAKEPLVHFLALGAFIFVLDGLLAGSGREPEQGRRVVVDAERIAWLLEGWTRQWRRPPTEAELRGLIEAHIREEVLYREALTMGLDQDDTIVRRRLVQKLEFLTEDMAAQSEPTDEQLTKFLEENRDRYQVPERMSFTHIYFSTDDRGAKTEEHASRVLAELQALPSPPDRAPERGDRFMLQTDFDLKTEQEVALRMGTEFARDLFALESDGWEGPIGSGYGLHLVRVHERVPGREPELDQIRKRIVNDFTREQRQKASDDLYARLRAQYEIVVDDSAITTRMVDPTPAEQYRSSPRHPEPRRRTRVAVTGARNRHSE